MNFEQELKETVERLPQQPPEETIQVLIDRGFLKGEALIYKIAWVPGIDGKKRKMVEAHCTACGQVMYMEYVKNENPECYRYCYTAPYTFIHPDFHKPAIHGEPTLCPLCGASVDVKHISCFSGDLPLNSQTCVSVHEVKGHLCLLMWTIYKKASKDGEVFFSKAREEGVLVINKKIVRLVGFVKNNMCSGRYLPKWECRKKYLETFGPISKKIIIPFKKKTVYATDSANCALYEFINKNAKSRPTMYLRLWRKYPQVENISKTGFGKLLNSALEEAASNTYYGPETMNVEKIKEIFDFTKAKPSEMMKITKQEVQNIKLCDLDTFRLYRFLKDTKNFRMTAEYIRKSEKLGASKLFLLFNQYSLPPIRVMNYIEKQKKHSDLVDGQYLCDYWAMLKNIYGEIPKEVQFPRDLRKAHDDVLRLQKEKEEREISKQILEHAKQYEDLFYENESLQLMIRPCRSQSELITEGKLLNHCVARYAKAVAKGETMIFFIRKMGFPNDPFYTLEYKNGVVIQNRGKGNCSRTKEVELFEKLWLERIKKIRRKNNGKQSTSADAAS